MVPAFKKPNKSCITPAKNAANKKASKLPNEAIAANTIAVSPAAGPETLRCDVLKYPTTIPPMIPEIIPEKSGAPLANAIPKHKGNATKKTTKPDAKSDFRLAKRLIFFVIPI